MSRPSGDCDSRRSPATPYPRGNRNQTQRAKDAGEKTSTSGPLCACARTASAGGCEAGDAPDAGFPRCVGTGWGLLAGFVCRFALTQERCFPSPLSSLPPAGAPWLGALALVPLSIISLSHSSQLAISAALSPRRIEPRPVSRDRTACCQIQQKGPPSFRPPSLLLPPLLIFCSRPPSLASAGLDTHPYFLS